VLERPTPLPPAFAAYSWRPSSGLEGSLSLMRSGSARQARDVPVIEGESQSVVPRDLPATRAPITRRTDTEVIVEADARRAGQLVGLDTSTRAGKPR
jgi:hypothetical protein